MKSRYLVLVLSYVGGALAQEPLSPFGPPPPNPFGNERREPENPFERRQEPRENPFQERAGENPFQERREENPFAQREQLERAGNRFGENREQDNRFRQPEHLQENPFARDEQQARTHFSQPQGAQQYQGKNTEDAQSKMVDAEVDTFDQEGSGNWLLKRVWWEKTEAVYEQIKQVFNDVMNARMDFVSLRNRFDREADIAYGQLGIDQGVLQETLDSCLALAKEDKKEKGYLDKEEEAWYKSLEKKQHDLEQVKLDIQALQAVDQKLDEALDTLFKQIDVANQYEQKAWQNFKDIARELNDKVARKSYYETEGLLKDIQNIHSYITDAYSSYFHQTVQTARGHLQTITSQVFQLKEAGIDLKRQAELFESGHKTEQAKKAATELNKKTVATQKKSEKKKESEGFVHTIKLFFLTCADRVLKGLGSVISSVKGWFIKEESVVQAREKKIALDISKEQQHDENAVVKELDSAQKSVSHEEEKIHPVSPFAKEAQQENVNPFEHREMNARPEEPRNPFEMHPQARPEERHEFEEPFRRPVSVMPEGREEGRRPGVETFGLPPSEEHREGSPFEREHLERERR